jgi:hypothetical protein
MSEAGFFNEQTPLSKIEGFSNQHQKSGAPDGIRTHGPQIRNLMLYPAELRARWCCFSGASS